MNSTTVKRLHRLADAAGSQELALDDDEKQGILTEMHRIRPVRRNGKNNDQECPGNIEADDEALAS